MNETKAVREHENRIEIDAPIIEEVWRALTVAGFQPVKYPEVGVCVHKLLAHPR
jgi:hypothetical protein